MTRVLTDDCGHHCVFKDGIERHCQCAECHGQVATFEEVIAYAEVELRDRASLILGYRQWDLGSAP